MVSVFENASAVGCARVKKVIYIGSCVCTVFTVLYNFDDFIGFELL